MYAAEFTLTIGPNSVTQPHEVVSGTLGRDKVAAITGAARQQRADYHPEICRTSISNYYRPQDLRTTSDTIKQENLQRREIQGQRPPRIVSGHVETLESMGKGSPKAWPFFDPATSFVRWRYLMCGLGWPGRSPWRAQRSSLSSANNSLNV